MSIESLGPAYVPTLEDVIAELPDQLRKAHSEASDATIRFLPNLQLHPSTPQLQGCQALVQEALDGVREPQELIDGLLLILMEDHLDFFGVTADSPLAEKICDVARNDPSILHEVSLILQAVARSLP